MHWLKRKPSPRVVLAVVLGVVVLVLAWGALPEGPLVITPPPADADPGRWVHVEGAANTRDAGGYPTTTGQTVRRGAIYRSGKLHRITTAGAATYRDLGIRTVIDFRNRLTPWPLFGGDAWAVQFASSVHGCPMSFRKHEPRDEFYVRGVRDNADAFRNAFALLAEPANYPVLYHCAIGVDRTGVMSALLLSLLDVDRDTIIADFRLSEQVDLPGNLRAMHRLFDEIDAAGGITPYLRQIGVGDDMQRAIRAALLEPAAAPSPAPATAPAVLP
jgi:hypothetical protein